VANQPLFPAQPSTLVLARKQRVLAVVTSPLLKELWSSRDRRATNEPADHDTIFPIWDIGILPMQLARHVAMQSGCFTLIDRSASFAMGEREINSEMGGSKIRKTIPARWGMKVEAPQPTVSTDAGVPVL